MSWVAFVVNAAVCVGVLAFLLAATFAYAARTGVHAVMDIMWSLGFVAVAVTSYGLSAGEGVPARRALVLALTAVWGVRLAAYIGWRNHGRGEDKRYTALLRHGGDHPLRFAARYVYWAQGRVLWFVSLPIQAAMYSHHPLWALDWVGVALWAVGLAFEAGGDAQLVAFKSDPANAGKVMDRGLWRWTRHPNYFGDACVMTGLWLMSCSSWIGIPLVTAPALMTFLLVKRTGKALLEKTMLRSEKGDAYRDYVERTSGFFPRPPRPPATAPAAPAQGVS